MSTLISLAGAPVTQVISTAESNRRDLTRDTHRVRGVGSFLSLSNTSKQREWLNYHHEGTRKYLSPFSILNATKETLVRPLLLRLVSLTSRMMSLSWAQRHLNTKETWWPFKKKVFCFLFMSHLPLFWLCAVFSFLQVDPGPITAAHAASLPHKTTQDCITDWSKKVTLMFFFFTIHLFSGTIINSKIRHCCMSIVRC